VQTDFASRMHRTRTFDTGMGGIIYIAAGMDYNPIDADMKRYLDEKYSEHIGYTELVYKKWEEHRDEVLKHIETLPSHREFLAQHIHK
jgi:hypothetical protein